jgi:cell division cycle protein 20 (cofactor of APC complex)
MWSLPSLRKIYDKPAHSERVLSSVISPDGCIVATISCDETLRLWKLWEVPKKKQNKKGDAERARMLAGLR